YSGVVSLLQRGLLAMLDHWTCRLSTAFLTQVLPRVHLVREEFPQVSGVPPEDLQPDMAVIGLLRREMHVSDHQRLRVNQNRGFHRLKRVICSLAVVVTRLTTLEATGIDCSSSREISLLRRSAEQTAERPHRDLLLPVAE